MSLLERHIRAIEELLAHARTAYGDPPPPEIAEIRSRLDHLRALAFARGERIGP